MEHAFPPSLLGAGLARAIRAIDSALERALERSSATRRCRCRSLAPAPRRFIAPGGRRRPRDPCTVLLPRVCTSRLATGIRFLRLGGRWDIIKRPRWFSQGALWLWGRIMRADASFVVQKFESAAKKIECFHLRTHHYIHHLPKSVCRHHPVTPFWLFAKTLKGIVTRNDVEPWYERFNNF